MIDEVYAAFIGIQGVDGVVVDRSSSGEVLRIRLILDMPAPGDDVTELLIESRNAAGLRITRRTVTEDEIP